MEKHIETLLKKNEELGRDEVARLLGIKAANVSGFVSGRYKVMGAALAARVDQVWPQTLQSAVEAPAPATGNGAEVALEPTPPPVVPQLSPHPIVNVAKPTDGRNTCFLLPVYKSFESSTVMALLAMWNRAEMRVELRAGDAMIARSRNHLAKRFLETGAEWSFWMDDDVIPPCGSPGLWRFLVGGFNPSTRSADMNHWSAKVPDNFLEKTAMERLKSWGKKIMGGLYFDRWGMGTVTAGYSVAPPFNPPYNGIHPVDFCGTGCLLVHRDVYVGILEKFPECLKEDAPGNESGFFTPLQTPQGRMMGEDEAFGWRAAQAGFQSFIDFGCICGHVGIAINGIPQSVTVNR